jgi:phosphate uptake regulator
MSNDKSAAPKSYDRAREMTEKALEAFADGDETGGAKLVERAKDLNKAAVRDVHEELSEDAASEHDPKKLDQSVAKKSPT